MTLLFTGADILFKVPLLGRLMTWWGMTKVSKHVLVRSLTLEYPCNLLMIQPDGIQGMFYGLDHEQIVLNKRKGFCNVALRSGASLVPCYVMGANQLYNRRWGPQSHMATMSRRLHVSLVFWWDRFGVPFGFVPNRQKLIIVVGRPIHVHKVTDPTTEQVVELHGKFVTALKQLFQRHKYRMGSEWAATHDRIYLEDEKLPPTGVMRQCRGCTDVDR
jgi:2-acylglycerol O-acyltransferase 2